MEDEGSELYLLSRFAPSSSSAQLRLNRAMDHHPDLSSELDPTLLMSTTSTTSSSSPPDSASPSFSFSPDASPTHYTFSVTNLSCPAPPRRSTTTALLPPFLSSFSSSSSSAAAAGAGDDGLLLKSVSFTASSSNILAVVGPSGAGKSTLLRILSGRGTGSELSNPGTAVSLNGHAITSRSKLRRLCGFVTQDDNLLPLLTVRETILFAARFRLRTSSAATARERRLERVDALIHELGLSEVADSYVGGGGGARGVSGGERKRVSIAVDMVHDPPVLLLDEPTSGLDSRSAMDVLALLHGVSRARRQVVVLSIHQPSYRMLAGYISSLLLLSHGAVAHSGTLKSLEDALARLGHKIPIQVNPLELAMEVTDQLKEQQHNHHHHAHADNDEEEEDDHDEMSLIVNNNDDEVPDEQGYCSRWTEVTALTVRCWRTMYRTRELFAARAAQAVVGGLGLGSVYFRLSPDNPDGVALRLGLFAFTLSFLLSSTVEALPILLHERRVLMREASRRAYRLSSYVVANAAVFAPCLLAVSLLFSAPLYWMAGLRAGDEPAAAAACFGFFVLAVWLIVLMASSLVLFLSAVSPDFVLGNALICVCLGVFFLFSGYFIPKESIPRYWGFMYYVSMYRYPLDLLLINEYGGSARGKCVAWVGGHGGGGNNSAGAMAGGVCLRTGADVLRDRGIDEGMKWVNVGVMVGFFLLYRVMCWAVLVRRASKTTL